MPYVSLRDYYAALLLLITFSLLFFRFSSDADDADADFSSLFHCLDELSLC